MVSALVRPDWTSDEAALQERLAAESDRELAAVLLALVGCALLVAAVLALLHMLRERRTAAGHAAGAAALVGVFGLGLHYAIELVIWALAQPDNDPAETTAVLRGLLDEPVIVAGFSYLPLAIGLGLGLLAIVLRAAQAVEPWTAWFLLAGAGLAAAALFVADATLLKIGWGVVLAGSNKIGVRVLRQDDYDWQHWPSWTFTWSWRR